VYPLPISFLVEGIASYGAIQYARNVVGIHKRAQRLSVVFVFINLPRFAMDV
jgi:hypothetical protein